MWILVLNIDEPIKIDLLKISKIVPMNEIITKTILYIRSKNDGENKSKWNVIWIAF